MLANISPSQRFLDAPFVLDQGAAGKWRPGNYSLDFNGPGAHFRVRAYMNKPGDNYTWLQK
jgi:membrane carboxypeptidase/penicillin-binding protein